MIVVLDEKGDAIASSQAPLMSFNEADSECFRYFQSRSDDSLHISPPMISPNSGKPVVVLSRRLSAPDGSFAGVVAGAILLDYFRGLFTAVGADRAGTVTLYGPNGLIVMREPFSAEAIGTSVAETPSYRKMTGERSGSFRGPAMVGAGDRYFVFAQVGDLPLKLSVGLSPDEVFSAWRWKAISLGGIVLCLCGVTMILSWLLRRELGRRDLAERATAAVNAELEKLATTDALTGLFNRRRFDEVLAREVRRALRTGRPLSLLLLDADCFKGFNDRYGHQKGDEALRVIARAIAAGSDPTGDIACRIGGEEFAVIFPDTELASAEFVANRIRAAVAGFRLDHEANAHGILTVSGGVAQMPFRGIADDKGIVAAADTALYGAKRGGRNRIVVSGWAMPPHIRIASR
ncbi:diguanylate cyclase [Beijerinckia sp. L45]|uniref:sensor domain-containing diguanylate cyclase n=1 Tax=Beijerinckia sp. L45 TaxID=1641855 RepID=UPI00131AE54F|nr:diguanylate cyclase [Beijerinckia sp. L45]